MVPKDILLSKLETLIWWEDSSVGEELVGQLTPEGSGQQLGAPVGTDDKWWSLGVLVGSSAI